MKENKKMRQKSYLSIQHVDDPQSQSLTVTLPNTQSINKHLFDVNYDKKLRKIDLICLIETQMMQRSKTEVNSELEGFETTHNTKIDSFQI